MYATGGYVTLNASIPKDESAAIAKLNEMQKASSSPSGLSGADASISQVANLNKMLILSQKEMKMRIDNNLGAMTSSALQLQQSASNISEIASAVTDLALQSKC